MLYLFQDISLVCENHYVHVKKLKSFLNTQGDILTPAEALLFPVGNAKNVLSPPGSYTFSGNPENNPGVITL